MKNMVEFLRKRSIILKTAVLSAFVTMLIGFVRWFTEFTVVFPVQSFILIVGGIFLIYWALYGKLKWDYLEDVFVSEEKRQSDQSDVGSSENAKVDYGKNYYESVKPYSQGENYSMRPDYGWENDDAMKLFTWRLENPNQTPEILSGAELFELRQRPSMEQVELLDLEKTYVLEQLQKVTEALLKASMHSETALEANAFLKNRGMGVHHPSLHHVHED